MSTETRTVFVLASSTSFLEEQKSRVRISLTPSFTKTFPHHGQTRILIEIALRRRAP
jgi:hypothetical protein